MWGKKNIAEQNKLKPPTHWEQKTSTHTGNRHGHLTTSSSAATHTDTHTVVLTSWVPLIITSMRVFNLRVNWWPSLPGASQHYESPPVLWHGNSVCLKVILSAFKSSLYEQREGGSGRWGCVLHCSCTETSNQGVHFTVTPLSGRTSLTFTV